jgi:zinc/manganese transport system substrate-binding protein
MKQFLMSLIVSGAVLTAAEPLPIVTGNTVVQDIVTVIGGEQVTAGCLLQAGVDPHGYQPVPADVKRIAAAKLVVINGLGFEGWFEGLAKEAQFGGTVVTATAGLKPLAMDEEHDHGHDHAGHDHGHGEVADPHAFNSIARGVRYAENIRDALIAADAAHAELYRARAQAYISELRAADAWAKQQVATVPKAQRKIVTNHDALQYFAVDYGFTVLAPNTALEDSQPSAKDLAAIVEFIRKEGVKGVFLEFGKNEKVVEQIAQEAGVKVGEELYLDGLGAPGTPAATYIGAFKHNVTAIVSALR